MKTSISGFLTMITFIALVFYGCTKTSDFNSAGNQQQSIISPSGQHVYGLIPMTPDQYLNIPLYSKESFQSRLKSALIAPAQGTSYSLATPPVRDQGQIGSCTAFCGAETDEILYYYFKNKVWPTTVSPAFIYYCERVLILKQKITADNGASMINIPQALQKYGDCLETTYPYPSSIKSTAYKTAPKSTAFTEALKDTIGQAKTDFAMISQGDVDAVRTLIANNTPVMLGFNVYDVAAYTLFEGLNTKSYTYNPLTSSGALVSGAKLLGGHAVPIVGYDDNFLGTGIGAFKCQNSWGTAWGNSGFFYMPYSVFKSTTIVSNGSVYYAYL